MWILLFGFVLSSSIDDEIVTLRNRKVMANKRLLSSGDVSAGWYFVHFKSTPKLTDLFNHGIEASTSSIVTKKWLKLYLESEEVKWLQSRYECEFSVVSIEDKLFLEEYEDDKKASLLSSDGWMNSFSIECKSGFTLPHFEGSSYERLGRNLYIIRFEESSSRSYIKKVLRSLSEMKEVASISVSHPSHVTNRWAGAYVQDMQNGVTYNKQYGYWQSYPKINQQGLKGEGVVITVSDSGLDWNHTFFYDPNYPTIEYNKTLNGHRKIKYYWSYKDEDDGIGGHGTHVCGTVAGKANCDDCLESEYNGIASESKIAFVDCGLKEDDEDIDSPPLNELANFAREQQSTILSASWGHTDDPRSRYESDAVWYEYSDLLFVHSAGNDGSNQELDTIGAMASKNTLTVGSLSSVFAPGLRRFIVCTFDDCDTSKRVRQIPFHYGFTPVTGNYFKDTCVDENASSCIEIWPFANFSRNWNNVLVFLKAHTNGNDVIITGLRSGEWGHSSLTNDQSVVLGITLPAHDSPSFNLFVTEAETIPESWYMVEFYQIYGSRAAYSSQGATPVGILKPDVAAPGTNIISSYSLNETSDPKNSPDHKGVTVMSGTSMSTPLVSGSIALIQEYLEKGYYCSHSANSTCDKFRKPSGVLLRSMIIASANRVGNDNKWPDPGMSYGFGVPDLSRVLPFDDSFSLHLVDGQHIENGEHLTAEFISKGSGHDLILSLSYVDPPLSIDSRMPLSIDLDLYVETPSGKWRRGNRDKFGDAPEHFSTNERIVIPSDEVEEGTYTIHIVSRDPNDIGADFSLACIGNSDQDSLLAFEHGSRFCIAGNVTLDDKCTCEDKWFGEWCHLYIVYGNPMVASQSFTKLLKSGRAFDFSVSVPDGERDILTIRHTRSESQKRFTHHLIYFSEEHEAEIPLDFDSVESYEMSYVKAIEGPKELRVMIYNYSPFDDDITVRLDKDGEIPTVAPTNAPSELSSSSKEKKIIAVGFVLVGVLAIVVVVLVLLLFRRRNETEASSSSLQMGLVA